MKKIFKFLVPILIIFIFLFLRLHNLQNTFFFYHEMGRDSLVLLNWYQSGKPPLLGPQTSALPINQSAIYFYLLYPGYLISNLLPISAVYTLCVYYLIFFIIGLYLFKDHRQLKNLYLFLYFIIAIHPQYIDQNHYIWNPSFVTPPVILAILTFYLLTKKFNSRLLYIFSTSIALAISLSYSIAPLLICFILYWILFIRKHFLKILLSIGAFLGIFNLPTILFEIRHKFLLTQSLFTKQSPGQTELGFINQLKKLTEFIINTPNISINFIVFILVFATSLFFIIRFKNKRKELLFYLSFLFITQTIFTLLVPVTVQAHYIFGLAPLLFLIIYFLPYKLNFLLVILLSAFYLSPTSLKNKFAPAPRTYNQLITCFKNYCQKYPQFTYVSAQSNYHPYHNGPEFRFLMRQNGCSIKDIETENNQAEYMSVILDNGTFSSKTNFYELELFGQYKDIDTFNCLDNFKIKVLEKI